MSTQVSLRDHLALALLTGVVKFARNAAPAVSSYYGAITTTAAMETEASLAGAHAAWWLLNS